MYFKRGLIDVCIVCIVTTELVGTGLIFIIKLNNKYFVKWLNMYFERGLIDVCIVCIVKRFNRHWLYLLLN